MPKVGTREPDGREELAVNLFDLDRIVPVVKEMLLAGNLDLGRDNIIRVDKDRMDETAVRFTCDLLTAGCILDTLRSHDRAAKDYPTRCYIRRERAWVKVPGHLSLTLVIDGKPVLNPNLFSSAVPASGIAPERIG